MVPAIVGVDQTARPEPIYTPFVGRLVTAELPLEHSVDRIEALGK